jgi:hypothetical protein
MGWFSFAKTWWGTTIIGAFVLMIAGLAARNWSLAAVAAFAVVYGLIVVAVKLRRGKQIV